MTLLIVDDELRIAQLIRQLIHFDKYGLELIDVFDDSEKAFGAILLHHPDIVISDIKMPVMDGLELVLKTQEAGLSPHFVFVSGFREFEYAHKALQYGVEDYLLKPVKEDELNAILAKITTAHEQTCQAQREAVHLQEAAAQARHIRNLDLIQAIDSQEGRLDWAELNGALQTQVDPGKKMTAFALCLDYYDDTQRDDIQDRMVINNLISMTESRLRPYVTEQLYAVQDKMRMIGILNYELERSANIHQELYVVYSDIRQYLVGFPEYAVTLAFGDEVEPERIRASLQQARHRLNWRIVLGTNRVITAQKFYRNTKLSALDAIARAQLHNAVEALNAQAVGELWSQQLQRIRRDPMNDPAMYYELAISFLELFYENLTWNEKRSRQSRSAAEKVRRCWQQTQLSALVIRTVSDELGQRQSDLSRQAGRPVRVALDYIAENYARKISLEEIADMLQMNASYLSTLFKKETGKNFQNYLAEYRIERAKELLRTTNETMLCIAGRVGYQDTRYFSQSFMKIVGVKPSMYRKMYS